jgi:hypothetical protein
LGPERGQPELRENQSESYANGSTGDLNHPGDQDNERIRLDLRAFEHVPNWSVAVEGDTLVMRHGSLEGTVKIPLDAYEAMRTLYLTSSKDLEIYHKYVEDWDLWYDILTLGWNIAETSGYLLRGSTTGERTPEEKEDIPVPPKLSRRRVVFNAVCEKSYKVKCKVFCTIKQFAYVRRRTSSKTRKNVEQHVDDMNARGTSRRPRTRTARFTTEVVHGIHNRFGVPEDDRLNRLAVRTYARGLIDHLNHDALNGSLRPHDAALVLETAVELAFKPTLNQVAARITARQYDRTGRRTRAYHGKFTLWDRLRICFYGDLGHLNMPEDYNPLFVPEDDYNLQGPGVQEEEHDHEAIMDLQYEAMVNNRRRSIMKVPEKEQKGSETEQKSGTSHPPPNARQLEGFWQTELGRSIMRPTGARMQNVRLKRDFR